MADFLLLIIPAQILFFLADGLRGKISTVEAGHDYNGRAPRP